MTSHWVAVARSRRIGRRPHRILVDGTPLVLFRAAGRVHALVDRCPHRAAPLSRGRVVDDQVGGALLECAYHGWRFDGSGRCRAMPGLASEALPRVAVPARAAREAGGLVFVARGASSDEPTGEPYVCALPPDDRVAVVVESRVAASLIDVAENILDATHTHFTHKGLLRGLSGTRRRIEVAVTAGEDWIEARYEGEPRQEGLISRLLEAGRTTSIGRFLRSGIAELEFRGPTGINLTTTFHLREEMPGVTHGFAVLAGPRQHGLGYAKAALFLPLFRVALGQDRRILEACALNREAQAGTAAVVAPLDVLRPHIASLLAGQTPRIETPTLVMDL